jgi:hypothetical protein
MCISRLSIFAAGTAISSPCGHDHDHDHDDEQEHDYEHEQELE